MGESRATQAAAALDALPCLPVAVEVDDHVKCLITNKILKNSWKVTPIFMFSFKKEIPLAALIPQFD